MNESKPLNESKTVTVKVSTEDLLDDLVGEVNHYDRTGTYYHQEDGEPWSINGADVLDNLLDKINLLHSYKIQGATTTLEFDLKAVIAFKVDSGFRTADFEEGDAETEIEDGPSELLYLYTREFEVSVDPLDFAQEDEQLEDARDSMMD